MNSDPRITIPPVLNELQAGPAGVCGYGLVRGKDGLPRVDDLSLMPLQVWESLTSSDQSHLLAVHGEYKPVFA